MHAACQIKTPLRSMPDSGTITNYFASGARFARNVFMYDFEVAEATYRAAVARWPAARITLRQLVGGGADGSASYSFVVFCSSTQAARSREA
jgi:hypothetical protein